MRTGEERFLMIGREKERGDREKDRRRNGEREKE